MRKGSKNRRTTVDVSAMLVGSRLDRPAQKRVRCKMQRSPLPSRCASFFFVIEGPMRRVTLVARLLLRPAGRRISHEGFGTPRGPPARSPGPGRRCSTLSTTALNCSRPVGSNTSSCSRPLKHRFLAQRFDWRSDTSLISINILNSIIFT